MEQCKVKIGLPALLILGILGATTFAGLATLPESAAGYSGTSWYQGVKLEYRVYDTQLQADALKIDAPGTGRYVYAYQAFNLNGAAIAFLSLQGISEEAIKSTLDVGSVESDGGVAPTARSLNSEKTIVTYEFGNGSLTLGKNSWFLTIRSDGKPKAGTFTFTPPIDNDIVLPGAVDTVPEPMTLSMLLLGAAGAMVKRSKR